MLYFAHGDHHNEEIVQTATQSDNTALIVVGILILAVGFILISRYLVNKK